MVAREMNMSEGRVSQLTGSALARLKRGILRELKEKQVERQLAVAGTDSETDFGYKEVYINSL